MRRRPVKIAVDLTLLVGFVAEFLTREGPDYDVHSWIGILVVPVIVVHLVSNKAWIAAAWARRSTHPEWRLARLNATFGGLTLVCLATGFPIWLEWSEAGAWSAVHTITGFASLIAMGAHVWMNRSRVRRLLGR